MIMSRYIHDELLLFLKSVGLGAFFLLYYDIISGFRSFYLKKRQNNSIWDFLFWISCVSIFFFMMDMENQGGIRGYILCGIMTGVWLNYKIFHPYIIKMEEMTGNMVCDIVKKMRNRLLFLGKRCKIHMYKFANSRKIGEKRMAKSKKGHLN